MNDPFQKTEQWFAATLKSIGEAVIATDSNGAIVFMNAVAETLTGWAQTEALGKNILFLPSDGEISWGDTSQSDIVIQLATDPLLLSRHGRAIPIEYTGAPIKDQRGNVAGVVLVIQDVTERKHAEHALRQAKNTAEEAQRAAEAARRASEAANRAKSLFLANMGHELRTPLNAVLGYAQILQEAQNLTPHQRRNIAVIQRSGEHLLTLLDDILDVSAFESGKLELHAHEFELAGLLRTIRDIAEMLVAQKGLMFRLDQQPGLPVRLYADEQRLRQVLLNLLKNATKFTEHGSVTLKIEHCEKIMDGDQSSSVNLQFSITDTGIGIALDKLRDIFLPFQQIDSDYHAIEGAGLGLAICQRLLACMGSELQVQSSPGQGSRFWFDIRVPAVFNAPLLHEIPAKKGKDDLNQPAPEQEKPEHDAALLPEEILQTLLSLAKRGNPRKLLAELEALVWPQAAHHPVLTQLRIHAADYQIERCLDVLYAEQEKHQHKHENKEEL